ncbi:HD-GYP domain-containing protein [Brevibacillus sp. GCM10020057]|uniref:HD-GYP domain-containing protein n=1 Tax=Brevibacillus sp. GCM10020057 TaxID=3317327 RepID=UPI0036421C23
MLPKINLRNYVKGFIVQIGYIGLAFLIIYSAIEEWNMREHWGAMIIYALLTVGASFAPIRTFNSTLTLNNAVICSGIILYGAWIGVWSALIETLMLAFLVRFHPLKALSNVGQILITIWVVEFLKNYMGGYAIPPIISDMILAVVYWYVNMSLCAMGISYYFKVQWLPTMRELARGTTLTYLLLMVMGCIGSRLVEIYGLVTLIPILGAFITMSFVYHQYYDSLNKLQQKVEEVKSFNHRFLMGMAASIDARDRYTSGHSQRVAHWGREIAKEIGLPPEKVEEIYIGGILHDIGKIGIKDEILNKKGRLTPEEYDKIKQHTVIGYEIILQAGMFNELLPAIRSHHERIDGKGYPDGLVGDEIPLMAKILAISDSFDAMVADRPYRKGLPVEEALNEIRRGFGTQFDEKLAGHFIDIIQRLPRDELESIIGQEAQAQKQLQEAMNE